MYSWESRVLRLERLIPRQDSYILCDFEPNIKNYVFGEYVLFRHSMVMFCTPGGLDSCFGKVCD